MDQKPPFTSRRGFIAAMGFGAVSLYGLWAAYGAAPGLSGLFASSGAPAGHGGHGAHGAVETPASAGDGGHGGHGGHGAAGGQMAEDFEREAEAFVARYRLADGSVHPRRLVESHGATAMITNHGAMNHGAMNHGTMNHGTAPMMHGAAEDAAPLAVYMLARRWSYEPGVLRLDRGVAYRFRMMAADTTHGASIHLGDASRIIRLRPGVPAEQTLTFHEPGAYLVYCTVYCGAGHDAMQGRIIVA